MVPGGRTILVVVILLATVASGATIATDQAVTERPTVRSPDAAERDISPDSVLLRVQLHANGSATWAIEYRYRLVDENESAAFASLRREIDADREGFVSSFARRLRGTVAAAQDDTGREMRLGPVSVVARHQTIPDETGIVTYGFAWHGFAVTDDGAIRAGDALAGFYLSPATTLSVSWDDTYAVSDVSPVPAEQGRTYARWTGERQFDDRGPQVRLSPARPAATDTGPPAKPDGRAEYDRTVVGSTVLVGMVAIGGVYLYRRRAAGGASTEPTTEPPTSATADSAPPTVSPAPSTETALLSTEEQVHRALRTQGGRMKQQHLAEACGWGASKTSKVVSKMNDSEQLRVYRIGRENVVALPGEGFDDE